MTSCQGYDKGGTRDEPENYTDNTVFPEKQIQTKASYMWKQRYTEDLILRSLLCNRQEFIPRSEGRMNFALVTGQMLFNKAFVDMQE